MKELEARKAALVAESEVYRHTLRAEVQNLRIYSLHMKQRVTALTDHPLVRVLSLAGTLVGSRFGGGFLSRKRRFGPRWLRLASTAYLGWKTFRRLSPFLRGLSAQFMRPEHRTTARENERAAK
jgi:hypothetical protein